MNQTDNKQKVREFYDEIGWSKESSGYYQNARYEDLRPVSAEYIHKCHMRITPYFEKGGKYLLDVGCGPIQYKEYLTYSEHFEKRVCADISLTALKEARNRIGSEPAVFLRDRECGTAAEGKYTRKPLRAAPKTTSAGACARARRRPPPKRQRGRSCTAESRRSENC